jgi:hypothetical protein
MFWQNWVNEKMVKFLPLPRPVDVRYVHIKRWPEQSSFQIREVFGVSFRTRKVMAKIKRAKNVPKSFVLQKPANIQNNLDNILFV